MSLKDKRKSTLKRDFPKTTFFFLKERDDLHITFCSQHNGKIDVAHAGKADIILK